MTVTAQPLFYQKPVVLDKNKHAKLGVDPRAGFGFARETHAVGIAAVEFAHAAREYPIVFAADGDSVFPLVVLGLKQNENLFVSGDGEWEGKYIPAYVRRYPFILASRKGTDDFAVCIDDAYGGWSKKKGERLFSDEGEQTQFLERSMVFLRDFQVQHERTREFSEHLRSLDILEPVQANIAMNSGEKLSLGGFQVVNKDKLKDLDGDKLAALVKTDQMELVYLHLFSMANFPHLVEKVQAKTD